MPFAQSWRSANFKISRFLNHLSIKSSKRDT